VGVSPSAGPLSTIQVPRRFTVDEWGGTETTVLQTSRAMNALGHRTRIFTSLALASRREERMEGVAIRRFPYVYPFLGLSPEAARDLDKKGGNLLSFGLLRALLREKSIDLLHAHSGKRLGAVVRTAARIRRIPYVVTLHGGHFEIPAGEMQQMLTPIRGRLEWGRAVGALLGARRVLDDAAAIICVGRDEYEAASRRFPDKRVELLPNGVDSAFFSQGDGDAFRTRHGIPADRRVVLCVGRIDYQKNQLGLVRAFELLKRQEPRAHLVLLGPVTVPDYREKLGDSVEARALHDRVTIVPALRWDDPMLAGAYHASDVFCLPSLHEPFGMVILEAWSAGAAYRRSRPMVTTSCTSTRNVRRTLPRPSVWYSAIRSWLDRLPSMDVHGPVGTTTGSPSANVWFPSIGTLWRVGTKQWRKFDENRCFSLRRRRWAIGYRAIHSECDQPAACV
jgi:glycosyltransferase involved in cell wall biosynthesis